MNTYCNINETMLSEVYGGAVVCGYLAYTATS